MILIGDRYEIIQELDYLEENKRYEAVDLSTKKKCFIKIIDNSGYIKSNFLPNLIDESMRLRDIKSPYILGIENVGVHRISSGELIYIVSEYMEGVTLEELMNGNYLHYDALIKIAVQISRALQSYCRNGRYHGSLKADAIIIDKNYNIMVDDFGVTYANSGVNIRGGNNIFYLAPSQMSVDLSDIQSDFFSLGLILYSALYKRFPFVKTVNEDIRLKSIDLRINLDPPNLKEKHEKLAQIIQRLLSRNTNEKYTGIVDLTKDLTEIMYSELSNEFILDEDKFVDFEAHLDKTGKLSPDILYKTGKIDTDLVRKLAEEQRKERERKKMAEEAEKFKKSISSPESQKDEGKNNNYYVTQNYTILDDSNLKDKKKFTNSLFFKLTMGILILLLVLTVITYLI